MSKAVGVLAWIKAEHHTAPTVMSLSLTGTRGKKAVTPVLFIKNLRAEAMKLLILSKLILEFIFLIFCDKMESMHTEVQWSFEESTFAIIWKLN